MMDSSEQERPAPAPVSETAAEASPELPKRKKGRKGEPPSLDSASLRALAQFAADEVQRREDRPASISLADHPLFIATIARMYRSRKLAISAMESILRDPRFMRELLRCVGWSSNETAEALAYSTMLIPRDLEPSKGPKKKGRVAFGLVDDVGVLVLGFYLLPILALVVQLMEGLRPSVPLSLPALALLVCLLVLFVITFRLFRSDVARHVVREERMQRGARKALQKIVGATNMRGNIPQSVWRRAMPNRGCSALLLSIVSVPILCLLIIAFGAIGEMVDDDLTKTVVMGLCPFGVVLTIIRVLAYAASGVRTDATPGADALSRLIEQVRQDEWAPIDDE